MTLRGGYEADRDEMFWQASRQSIFPLASLTAAAALCSFDQLSGSLSSTVHCPCVLRGFLVSLIDLADLQPIYEAVVERIFASLAGFNRAAETMDSNYTRLPLPERNK